MFILRILVLLLISLNIVMGQELSGNIALEGRLFPESPLSSEQHGSSLSLSLKPELYYDWDGGYQSILVVPFF